MARLQDQFKFPSLGISLNYLISTFSKTMDPNMTVSQLFKRILDQTKSPHKSSLAEMWMNSQLKDENQKLVVKPQADYYVVHVWSYKFVSEVLDALRAYQTQISEPDMFVWIDVFCMNLHNIQKHLRVYPWWGHQFLEDLKKFKEVIVVWVDWPEAHPLKRTWCVWEIYAALNAQVPLGVALGDIEKLNLPDQIIDNFGKLVVKLKNFDMSKTEGYDRRMRNRTFKAVTKQEENFDDFNKVAISAVCQWWAMQGYQMLDQIVEIYETEADPAEISKFLRFTNCLCQLFRIINDVETARQICESAVNIGDNKPSYIKLYPRERARDLNNLGVLLSEIGDFEGAIQAGERCVTALKDIVLGVMDTGKLGGRARIEQRLSKMSVERQFIATALNNLGNLYFHLEQWEFSADRYQESVEIKVELYGPDNILVAAGMNNLGLAYSQLGDPVAAEKVFRQALQTRVRELGPNSIEVAQTRYNLAETLYRHGLNQEARQEVTKAFNVALKQLGPEHPATVAYQNLLNLVR